jgi:hypothetical protein
MLRAFNPFETMNAKEYQRRVALRIDHVMMRLYITMLFMHLLRFIRHKVET